VFIWLVVNPVSGSRFRYRCGSALLSVVCDCMRPWDPRTPTTPQLLRWCCRGRRGKSKAPNFKYDGPVSVIRLELDASDERVRGRLERQWAAVFQLRRALQRDAADRCRVYWAAHHERARDPKALRGRLGLPRKGIEAAAKAHIEASGWMRDHLTKAVGLHVADEVWETIDRHLFADSSGRRHGPPRIGSWWDFTRIPGRARSHTKATPTWETYRLVGTLDGHLGAYRHPGLPASVSNTAAAAARPAGSSILAQPARLPAPPRPASGWWADHNGVLAVVFTGLPAGDLVMPVRLPQGAGRWARLGHFLADPDIWHKIDMVRVRDRRAPGGWRYYAHLLVHQAGYQSLSTQARRAQIPDDRRAGIDANVSNLAVASFPVAGPEQLVVDQVGCTPEQRQAAEKAARWARDRQRALDRSRRNTNPDQYGPSARQTARTARRAATGLSPKQGVNPGGPRHARADQRPLRGYRHDTLSRRYRTIRADHAAASRSASQAKHARAQHVAVRIVAAHGNTMTVQDCRISSWARLWGKRIAVFSPGMLVTAMARECAATGGRLHRAGTRCTALSTACAVCGFPRLSPSAPTTARTAGCGPTAMSPPRCWRPACSSPIPMIRAPRGSTSNLPTPCGRGWPPRKSGRAQSTGTSHRPHQRPDRPGPAATTRWPLLSKQHSAHPRTDQATSLDVAGAAEKGSFPSCLALHDPLRVNS
jgi:hypothetical protein